MSLTSVGAEFLQLCRTVLREAEALDEQAQMLGSGHAGRLRVGASPQHIETVLAAFVPSFMDGHPAVEVELVEEGGARLAERLERGEIHLALIAADDTDQAGLPLGQAFLLVVTSPRHAWAGARQIDVRALADERILAIHRDFGSGSGWKPLAAWRR